MTGDNYLFDSNLTGAIEDLIREAKNKLLLISPYIDLSPRVRSALKEQLDRKNQNFKLRILFGKNGKEELQKGKKPKLKSSLEFLMQFPNVEIRFEELLHAKFYINDYHMIFSSMNLYDYSGSRNIEFGILEKHSSKGLLTKAIDATDDAISNVVQNVSDNVFGTSNQTDPIKKFDKIFSNAELLYETEPILGDKKGMGAKLIGSVGIEIKEIIDKRILKDELSNMFKAQKIYSRTLVKKSTFQKKDKLVSATVLGKALGKNYKEVVADLQSLGLINIDANHPTELGLQKGIELKSTDKGNWMVYPESILNEI